MSRKSQLTRDIEAIAAIDKIGIRRFAGFVATSWNEKRDVEVHFREHGEELGKSLKKMFRGYPDRNARIGVVVSTGDSGSELFGWVSAVKRFCKDNIAGLLVLEPYRLSWSSDRAFFDEHRALTASEQAERLFSLLPDDVLEAGMPIVFDGSGLARKFFKKSKTAKLDKRLSFGYPSKLDEAEISSFGLWCRGHFPIYDATGTAEEDAAVQATSWNLSNRRFGDSLYFLARCGFSGVLRFLPLHMAGEFIDGLFPGIIDLNVLAKAKWQSHILPEAGVSEIRNFGYAVSVSKDKTSWIEDVDSEISKMHDIALIIERAFEDAEINFDGETWPGLEGAIEMFAEKCEEIGVGHSIEAWKTGVPVEDIAA